jgi:hypothetical protein
MKLVDVIGALVGRDLLRDGLSFGDVIAGNLAWPAVLLPDEWFRRS